MKKTTMIVMIAAGLAMQAMAAGPENNTPSASTKVNRHTVQRVYQYLEPKGVQTYKIERYGNISSRPWAQTVGWSAGPSQFANDRERFHDAHFNLFWLGSTPQ